MITLLIANLSDIAETIKSAVDTREAIIGWTRANVDVVTVVLEAHERAAQVRGSLAR